MNARQFKPEPYVFPDGPCFFTNITQGVPLSSEYSCAPGYYCPNTSPADPLSLPAACPGSLACQTARLNSIDCGPQGKFEPSICPPGSYCPIFREKFVCPAGSYCPSGSIAPIKCDLLAICPEGTVVQKAFSGIVVCAVLDVVILVIFLVLRLREIKAANGDWKELLPAFVRRAIDDRLSSGREAPLAEVQNTSAETAVHRLDKDAAVENVEARGSSISSSKKAAANSVRVSTSEDFGEVPFVNVASLSETWRRGLGGRDLRLDFTFTDMGLQLPSGKQILQGVNGQIKSSRMTAIMGPSGAGKTTFMNVLCGKVNRTKGELFVNGNKAEIPQYKKVIGYVPQDDIMIRELTVREVVLHSAKCRLPRSWTSAEVETHVDDLLQALNLSHVAHTPIGDETTRGISGGQRKRVNIAMEMAAVPLCLFLDEPTSGLDSTAALDVADILSQVSQLGLTIVAVIHQPRIEIYRKFDDVLMIAPGGRTAYLGPTSQAKSYFESLGFEFDPNANEADVLMDILAGKARNSRDKITPDDLVRLWAERPSDLSSSDNDQEAGDSISSAELDKTLASLASDRGANPFMQAIYCHNRSVLQQQRLAGTVALEVIVGMLSGGLMGIASQGAGELFSGIFIPPYTPLSPAPIQWLVPLTGMLIGMSVGLAGSSGGVSVFSDEKTVYWREAAAGHSKAGYYIGKSVATFYRIVLSGLHFAAMYHFLAVPLIQYSSMYPIVLLLFYSVYGIAAIVSMIVSRENARLLSVITNLFAAVFCGYGPTLSDAKKWGLLFLWELSANKWSSEAFFSESIKPYRSVYVIDEAAKIFGYTLDRYALNLGMMLVLGTATRIVAFVLMLAMNRDKQR